MSDWRVTYGESGQFSFAVDDERIVGLHAPPPEVADIRGGVADALRNPLEFPPLAQCVFPDDRIAIVIDRRCMIQDGCFIMHNASCLMNRAQSMV